MDVSQTRLSPTLPVRSLDCRSLAGGDKFLVGLPTMQPLQSHAKDRRYATVIMNVVTCVLSSVTPGTLFRDHAGEPTGEDRRKGGKYGDG